VAAAAAALSVVASGRGAIRRHVAEEIQALSKSLERGSLLSSNYYLLQIGAGFM